MLYKQLLNTIGKMSDIYNKYEGANSLDIKDLEDIRRYSEIIKNLTIAINSDYREHL